MNRAARSILVVICCAGSAVVLSGPGQRAFAQQPATLPATMQSADELVTMDFPADGVELSLLSDIVTKRLHIPILYDDTIRNKKVVIRVPLKVPESALLGILHSALRLKQMALIDAEQPGWKQIVAAPNLAGVARSGDASVADGPIAQVFILAHADPTRISEAVRPFLTQPGGYIQAEAGQKLLIVGDYPSVIRRVDALIKKLDADAPPLEIHFVSLKEAEATAVAPAVTQLIASRESFQWGNAALSGVTLTADERTNQIAVIAPPARMAEVLDLIAGLDKSPELQTKVYRLKVISPDRLDRVIKGLLGPSLTKRAYESTVDRESQALVVAATAPVHTRITQLLGELDAPAPESESPIQFYRLKNTKAADVLATISGLLGEESSTSGDAGSDSAPTARATAPRSSGSAMNSATPPAAASATAAPSAAQQSTRDLGRAAPSDVSVGESSNVKYISPALPYTNAQSVPGTGISSVRGKNATVASDANTNSIIVVGPPPVQQMYAALIKRLDERRPQVQIECTIVTLDTSNSVTFGIDISHLGTPGNSQLLTLSSFGVSMADAVTGRLTPVNAPGGTFALLNPQVADVVIRALATSSRARFLSAPQLLVNDNGKGKLESVAQEPFAVILDASSTQSLTSLGGMSQAGTSITVEPHISEADYLQLSYTIELSNFTGDAQNGLPPPSQKNAVDSTVTIPDGYTIVVGGLRTKNFNASVNTVPVLGDIPVLKWLFGTRSKSNQDSTLFVFIRPVILRDDRFEDLKYLSGRSAQEAGLSGDFPKSQPIPMR
ncbi:MAG TPA: secretin N-terminal domain-containing protein [Humisphaera sp.]|jgi:general secretion pathway protein D|nr:secretin N-terminal domain-containing protein [Humisphaera sp.]